MAPRTLARFLLSIASASLVAVACGGHSQETTEPCTVLAAHYDQSCVSDSDCVLVPPGGNTCDPCSATEQPGAYYFFCHVAAVSASDSARYLAAIAPGQTAAQNGPQSCSSTCPVATATCVNGTCTAK
jgi:hypothetical protein